MFYAIAIMLLFVAVLLIFDHRSRYSWLFALMALSAVFAFFFMILHLSIFADYGYAQLQHPLYRLDYYIFRYVKRSVVLPIKTNIRLINLGLSLYLLTVMLFSTQAEHVTCREKHRNKRRRRMLRALCFVLPVLSMVIADPATSLRMYLHYHSCASKQTAHTLFLLLEYGYKIIVMLALLWPAVGLLRQSRSVSVRLLRRRLHLLAFGLMLCNGLFFMFFFVGECSMSVSKVITSGFWLFETIDGVIPSAYLNGAAPVFIVFAVNAFILISCQLDVLMTPLAEKRIRKNIISLNEAIGENLHSQKNLFFSMQILAGKVLQRPGAADIPEMHRLQAMIDHSLSRVTEMLNNLRSIDCRYYQRDLVEIIDQAVRAINCPAHVHIAWQKEQYDAGSYAGTYNGYCLAQALINVLMNAVEAIEMAGREKGEISVTLSGFFRWTVLCVTDNGCGISRKEISSIFEPHYSGKRGKMNWGLGLPYAYRVVKAHLGQIRVESVPNVYTTVVILLPAEGQHLLRSAAR